jgi:large subunit ribosomal protein L9
MRTINLILKEDVPALGDAGEVVKVKVGYARNFLLPKGKAILATDSKVKQLEHDKRVVEEKLAKEMKDLGAVRDRLAAVELHVAAKAGEEGKLFGSVTSAQVAELLAEKGFKIDRRKIGLSEPIKELGDHKVPVKLRGELVAAVTVHVTAEDAPVAEPDDAEE